jgi:anion transporter
MFVMRLSGSNINRIVVGLLIGTSLPAAFIGEHAVAGMYLPIAVALYTLTNKQTPSPNLGRLLALTIAFGCMIGGPMSPTGGARNAIMIGFLSDFGIDVSFMQWVSMGVIYTLIMIVGLSFIMPILFKPEVSDLSFAVNKLQKDLEKHGKMTGQQWLVAGIMIFVIFMWITDKTLLKGIFGFSLGLGVIAISGAVIYMLAGLTTWKDYEEGVSWGVVILYAGAISLGSAFKATGAASWLADSIMTLVEPLGMNSGVPLVILVVLVGACLTNLMSAGATVAVIGPVVLGMAENSGTNPLLVGIALAISSSAAFWLVIGTPASSIMYSSGMLEAKDFIRGGTLAWPLGLLVLVFVIIVFWIKILNIPVNL